MEIKNNEISRQFELKTETEKISVEYSFQEKKLFLTRINCINEDNKDLVEYLLKDIMRVVEEKRWRVVPTKPDISLFFKKIRGTKNF
nr:N-acetyltransferase [Flavobacterium agricola]